MNNEQSNLSEEAKIKILDLAMRAAQFHCRTQEEYRKEIKEMYAIMTLLAGQKGT